MGGGRGVHFDNEHQGDVSIATERQTSPSGKAERKQKVVVKISLY